MPHDAVIMGVYIPSLLVAAAAGILAATLTALLLNKYGFSTRFSNPPLAYVGFAAIYTVIFASTVFPA
jgi:hypothetical protein